MKHRKERVTVTVDRLLLRAGSQAVSAGRADSLSGWVNLALAERVVKEHRLQSLAEAVAGYEGEFGEISAAELAKQVRTDQRSAVVVRGSGRGRSGRRARRGAA